jgi:hypothetical protein
MHLLTLPEAADALQVPQSRLSQLLRDGQLIAVRDASGKRAIPATLIQDGAVVKSLPSVITQLRDARFADEEIVDWLHRPDESLRGTPLDALRANRGTEVKRRAQVAGF